MKTLIRKELQENLKLAALGIVIFTLLLLQNYHSSSTALVDLASRPYDWQVGERSQPLLASGVISGNGSVTKYGNSNLVLSAVNTYTGPTVVNAGGLAIGASGSIANSPLIQINPGTLLDTSAKPGGLTLAPGQTLNFNGSAVGDLTVGSGSTFLGSGVIANLGGELSPPSPRECLRPQVAGLRRHHATSLE